MAALKFAVGQDSGSGDTGTLQAGNVSDLVLLNGNPVAEIAQSANIAGVMPGSNWLGKEYIAAELKKLE